jgi:DNA repair exonuclease SbcCD ATPase subunit
MKIVQISDIHWRGIARHDEYTESFERLFDTLRRRVKPDLIINTGDTFHTKTQGITPEVIEKLSWMFRELADIAPTITILGNHDGNLTNSDRQDIVSPIHEAINHSDAYLYKKSGTYSLPREVKGGNRFAIHVFSPFDEDGWKNIKPLQDKVNIALFHGCISGSKTDMEFRLVDGERDVSFFTGMQFVLLGDIHKQQFLAYRLDKSGKEKPWVAYPGSFIQQNFGEAETKGFLVWDIKNEKEWDVEFHEHENRAPYVSVDWAGTVNSTLRHIEKTRKERAYIPGTRFRIVSNQPIQQVEARQLLNELKEHKGASEVVFKYDLINRMETIETDGHQVLKTNLRNDPEALVRLYKEFVEAHKESYVLNEEQLTEASNVIRAYLTRLNMEDIDNAIRNALWSLKKLKFDNIFRYGEGNEVNFDGLEGVVGIFGPNKIGKSSIIAAIMYALFNTTDRGPLKGSHIINKNKKSCSAELTFSVGGDEYIVKRETIRNSPKKPTKKDDDKTITSLNLYKIESDGSLTEKNSISRDETDREIRKLVGQPQDFLLTALSNQGGINKFIEEGATQRKSILSRFLDLELFDKLNVYAKDEYSALTEKTKKYIGFDWASALKRGHQEIEEIEKKISDIQTQQQSNAHERDELRLWMMQHQNVMQTVSLTRFNELKNDIESKEKTLAYMLHLDGEHEATVKNIRSELDRVKSARSKYDIKVLHDKLEKLDRVKSDISTLRQSFVKETETLDQQKKSIKRLETVPCGDSFPTCRFIKDSHADKKLVKSQEEKVRELGENIAELDGVAELLIQEKIAETLKMDEQASRLEFELETKLNKTISDKNVREKEIALIKSTLENLEGERKKLSDLLASNERKEYEKKRLMLDVIIDHIESREKEIRELFISLGGKNEKLKQLTKDRIECKGDLEKLKIYETVQQAFSKNGIPAMVLKTQLPAINMELAKILDNVVDFKVSLETDISSNVMDVYIEDGHSRRIIELASGMEKMICSLALRVALINLSSLSRPDIFIIDEGFGTLDQESMIKCMDLLTMFKSYFRTIMVITHVDPIKEVADKIIDIYNDGLESKVEA